MKRLVFLASAIVSVSLVSAVASADTVYANFWDNTGNAFASQNDTNPGGLGNYATVYDSFKITNTSFINEAAWIGEYFNGPQGSVTNFTLSFWNDNGAGAPGAFAFSESIAGNANEVLIANAGGFDCFSYDALLPQTIQAEPGTYWVSIVADQGFPPQWGWSSSNQGSGQAYQDFFGSRSGLGTNVTFGLYGTVTPEPASMALLGLGFVGLVRRRKNARA